MNKILKIISAPFAYLKELLLSKYVGGQLRTFLAALSGWMVSNDGLTIIEFNSWLDLTVKSLPALVAAISSAIQKKKSEAEDKEKGATEALEKK